MASPNTPGSSATKHWTNEGGSISYDDTGGPGRLVVAVPGMGQLRSLYRFTTPALVAAGYRVVTVDLRGMGSSTTAWSELSAEAIARDLRALLASLRAGPAVVIGNSLTSSSAVRLAARDPDHVAAIVLVSPVVHDPPVPPLQRFVARLALARPWGPGAWVGYQASNLYPARRPADLAEYNTRLKGNLREPGRMRDFQRLAFSRHPGADAALAGVRAPSLIVVGTKDKDFPDPAAEGRWVTERLHGRLEVLEGLGHYPMAEDPERFHAILLPFLAGLGRGA
jgi:pimeloyl-ACP methyl ester carboxylesterase